MGFRAMAYDIYVQFLTHSAITAQNIIISTNSLALGIHNKLPQTFFVNKLSDLIKK